MKKHKLLPILALTGIAKNKELYVPYLGAGIFASFLYFAFDSILYHPVMGTLPRAVYAYTLMLLGFGLLHIIMLPFLHYTYRFLIKRRKKELGLYSILGMEKKHIAMMMVYESVGTTFVMVFGGVLFGVVFSRLIFMLFFYMQGLPVLNEFPFSMAALRDTVLFFSFSALLNLAYSLYAVGKSNPIELLSDGRKGEKKLRFVGVWALLGLLILGLGYGISITSKFDGTIFGNFFLAVLLVIVGTYFLFTSGSVAALAFLRKRKNFYYKPSNFITVSGMYYRMKRNAAGLVNICIFSTMVIITLTCTASLYFGIDHVLNYQYPYDIQLVLGTENDRLEAEAYVRELEAEYGVEEQLLCSYQSIEAFLFFEKKGSSALLEALGERSPWTEGVFRVELLALEEYNRIAGESRQLAERELLFYSDGMDFGSETLTICGESYQIKEELTEFPGSFKAADNNFSQHYWIVVEDISLLPEELRAALEPANLKILASVSAADGEESKEEFAEALIHGKFQASLLEYRNNVEHKQDLYTMYGGLLFIGIFFALLFTVCLLIIMYYKQITEGYEDRDNFEIMQKVGMSREEVRATVAKQVLLVFFLPIFGAVCHTMAGSSMVVLLLGSISLFDGQMILMCCSGVLLVFLAFYGISYLLTAKTYMKIVARQR